METMMESAYEFLERKGITKVYQPSRRYNLSIAELVDFLDEYADKSLREFIFHNRFQKRTKSSQDQDEIAELPRVTY